LGDFTMAMYYALRAGTKFEVDVSSEFVDTLLRMCCASVVTFNTYLSCETDRNTNNTNTDAILQTSSSMTTFAFKNSVPLVKIC
jgi:hypothetical protein